MTAVRTSLHESSTTVDRLDAARRFAVLLDEHLAREEEALFPFLTAHVSEEEFEVIEQAVVEATSLGAMTFTVPWIVDEAPADLCAKVRDGLPTPIRLANRWVLQPRYRRLVAAATGVRVPRATVDDRRRPPQPSVGQNRSGDGFDVARGSGAEPAVEDVGLSHTRPRIRSISFQSPRCVAGWSRTTASRSRPSSILPMLSRRSASISTPSSRWRASMESSDRVSPSRIAAGAVELAEPDEHLGPVEDRPARTEPVADHRAELDVALVVAEGVAVVADRPGRIADQMRHHAEVADAECLATHVTEPVGDLHAGDGVPLGFVEVVTHRSNRAEHAVGPPAHPVAVQLVGQSQCVPPVLFRLLEVAVAGLPPGEAHRDPAAHEPSLAAHQLLGLLEEGDLVGLRSTVERDLGQEIQRLGSPLGIVGRRVRSSVVRSVRSAASGSP